MKLINDDRGAITVFLALILIPSIVVVGTLVDFTRYNTAKQIVNGAGELSLDSVLANYNSTLKNYYGLFAISSEEDCENTIKGFFEANLNMNKNSFQVLSLIPYNYHISDISNANLANPEALRNQIIEQSKYRAPASYSKKLLEIINKFKTFSNEAEIYDKEILLNEKLALLSVKYQKLYALMVLIDSFNVERFNNYISSSNTRFLTITDRLMSVKYLRNRLLNIDYSNDNAIDIEVSYKDRITSHIQSIKDSASKIIKQQEEDLRYYSKHLEYLLNIQELCLEINDKTNEVTNYIKELINEINQLEKESDNDTLKSLEQFKKRIENNSNSLINCDFEIVSSYIELNFKTLQEYMSETQKTKYVISLYGSSNNGNTFYADPKVYSLTTLKLLSVSSFQDVNATPAIKLTDDIRLCENLEIHGLPIYKFYSATIKEIQEIYITLHNLYSSGVQNAGAKVIKKATKLFSKAISKKLDKIPSGAKEIPKDIYDTFSSKIDYTVYQPVTDAEITYSKSIFDILKKSFTDFSYDLRDKLLIQHYINTMFTCITTKEGDNSALSYAFSPSINYLFGSEREYLLFGHNKASTNILYAKSLIYGLRFALNYKYAIGNSSLRTLVKELALLGSVIMPLSTPLLESTILAAIVATETALDLEDLMKGKEIAVIKTEKSWRLSVTAIKRYFEDKSSEIKPKKAESSDFKMSYQDYLGLLLLTVNNDTLMKRVGNLIELNMSNIITSPEKPSELNQLSFKTIDAKTAIKLEADILLKFIFIPIPFISDFINTKGIKGLRISYNNYRGY